MTPKQRLLAALRGEETDRIPWSPFLAYYWEAQPPEIQRRGQLAFMQELGADPLLRGFSRAYRVERRRCETRESVRGRMREVVFETPVGTLREVYTFSQAANTWFLTGHPVQSPEQVKILQFIYENTVVTADAAAMEADLQAAGEAALSLPVIGVECKTSFQAMVERWMGTENLVYLLCDAPETVEECLAAMCERDQETVELSARTGAEGFIFWDDSSTTNISPAYFRDYIAPEITRWGERLHRAGKLLIHHACGHVRDLLPLMAGTPVDAIESLSPPPTGNVEVADALRRLPERIGVVGGIEPTVLAGGTPAELETAVTALLESVRATGRRRYILANSDSCPPGVEIEKFRLITRLARAFRLQPASAGQRR